MKISKLFFNGIVMTAFIVISTMSTFADQAAKRSQLDEAAESYVKLALELTEYDSGYVDAYIGPEEWAKTAKDNLRSKEQLAKDIAALLTEIDSIKDVKKSEINRHKALYRNVRAMDVRVRMVNGEKFSFATEAKLIYDVVLPKYDFAEFDKALLAIDKLLPGEGTLPERVSAFRESFNIPEDKVKQTVDTAIAECRKRSKKYIAMPDKERFTLEYVTDKSWGGYNWYQGDNHSLMQINMDFPLKIGRPIGLGCHEGYPGHHVWNVMIENKLLKKNNWIEFTVFPLFSPFGLIAEGSANYGVELSFPGDEKLNYEMKTLYPIAGIDPDKAIALRKLDKLTSKLSHAMTATAELYFDGKITREEAVAQRQKYSLVSLKRAENSMRFIEQYRAYVLNYNVGKDIVSKYIKSQGDTDAERWSAFEKMLTHLLTASDMVK